MTTSSPDAPLTVGRLIGRARNAVMREFRGHPWVTGEVRRVREGGAGCSFELVEPAGGVDGRRDAVLSVWCSGRRWRRIGEQLATAGVRLADGMVVVARGEVDLWDSGGLRLNLGELDTDALLGALARRRAEARERLRREGLLDAQAGRPWPVVPLRVGLVASEDSQGTADFLGVLARSPFAFRVTHVHARVQGPQAPVQLVAALRGLSTQDCDVIVVVRGGGAAGDLVAFDDERVARAIAEAPVPVVVGIGHTGDRLLADEVAHAAHPTPTACAQALVESVSVFEAAFVARVRAIAQRTERALAAAADGLVHRRRYLAGAGGARLEIEATGVAGRRAEIDRLVRVRLGVERADLRHRVERLGRTARGTCGRAGTDVRVRTAVVDRAARRRVEAARVEVRTQTRALAPVRVVRVIAARRRDLERSLRSLRHRPGAALDGRARELSSRRRTLSALDPERQLARGWAVVRDESGRLVRDATAVAPGELVRVRLATGTLAARVEEVAAPAAVDRIDEQEAE